MRRSDASGSLAQTVRDKYVSDGFVAVLALISACDGRLSCNSPSDSLQNWRDFASVQLDGGHAEAAIHVLGDTTSATKCGHSRTDVEQSSDCLVRSTGR